MGQARITLMIVCLIVGTAAVADAATKVSVVVGNTTTTSVTVSWTKTEDACFHQYEIGYKPPTQQTWTFAASFSNPDTTTYTIDGLQPGTSYEVFVRDDDCLGSSDSDVRSFTTPSPPSSSGSVPGFEIIGALLALGMAATLVRQRRRN